MIYNKVVKIFQHEVDMDTQKLRAVMAAIRYKSLSKAALEFGYTPSAMTHIANSVVYILYSQRTEDVASLISQHLIVLCVCYFVF